MTTAKMGGRFWVDRSGYNIRCRRNRNHAGTVNPTNSLISIREFVSPRVKISSSRSLLEETTSSAIDFGATT